MMNGDGHGGSATTAEPRRISMEEAVGYPEIRCAHQAAVDEALVAKHGRLFMLVDDYGNVAPAGNCGLGLFQDDTRVLSEYHLTTSAGPLALLSSRSTEMYSIRVDLALDDSGFGGDTWDPRNAVHVRREIILDEVMTERVLLTNFLTRPVQFDLCLSVACDFADIFEVRGWKRARRGDFYEPEISDRELCFVYRGVDDGVMRSRVRFAAPPDRLDARRATWRISLAPNESRVIEWQAIPGTTIDHPAPNISRDPVAGLYESWRAECAAWSSDVEEFNISLEQAVTDLRGLYGRVDGDDVIYAGIPWYTTVFGRDSIITSLQTLPLTPRIARDTLRYLARHQGEREDPFTEEQPGKIMHELRRGELARAGEIPHLPYYGTIDATPLWLILLHETWRWTGDEPLMREMLPHALRALEWIDAYGDIDGDGFVEYHRTSDKGLVNQGWKDSGDGVPFPDGTLPEPPIALVEVQGYVYDAKLRMSQLFARIGEPERARALAESAARLRTAIHEHFWMDDLGTFALALDGQKRQVPTATSNAGHLLWSRVPTPEQAARMARHFMSPEMFCGWGVRTLGAGNRVFNPMSYHNGSVWPHDNAIVALGLSLAGRKEAALPIVAGLHDVARTFKNHRLPELFCGMDRGESSAPVHYPVSCIPQAWASGSMFMLLQAVTGILPDAHDGCVHVRAPQLPAFIRELTVARMCVGRSRVSLRFVRDAQRTVAHVLAVEGDPLRIIIEV